MIDFEKKYKQLKEKKDKFDVKIKIEEKTY
jgi:hypothetical protein